MAINAMGVAEETDQKIDEIIEKQIALFQSTLPKTMSDQTVVDLRAKIAAIGFDVLDIVNRKGQRK